MEYLIGVILTLAVAAFAAVVGFDRDRAFYSTVVIVIASSVSGFKGNYWLVVAAFIGHAVFDFVRQLFIDNPGVPRWWPGFCLASDVVFGAWVAVLLIRQRQPPVRASTA